METENGMTYLVYIYHLDKWYKAKCHKRITYYQKLIEYYTLLEGQLEGCIYSRSEIDDIKYAD